MQMLHFPMIERALEIRNEARKGFSDLNAAATLPATRTNEPRSHVLLSTLFIRVTLLVEITYIYIPAYLFMLEHQGGGHFCHP